MFTPDQRKEFAALFGLKLESVDPNSPEGLAIQRQLAEANLSRTRDQTQYAIDHGIPRDWLMNGPENILAAFVAKVETVELFGLHKSTDQIIREVAAEHSLPVPGDLVGVKCPKCGAEASISPSEAKPLTKGEYEARGKRSVLAKCPQCGNIFPTGVKPPVAAESTRAAAQPSKQITSITSSAKPAARTSSTKVSQLLETDRPNDSGYIGPDEAEARRHPWR